jgi:short subunit dehydrogenase-like uncharacterized protein
MLLIYGANGFVGREIARMAVGSGLKPILAGRDRTSIEALGRELGVEPRVFGLEDSSAVERGFESVRVVLHCAGPFLHTFRPVASACLATGAHYLDITGELPVYEALAALDERAQSRGVMLLPGVGFDVVPTDCLAVYLKGRLPSATRLTLAFQGDGPAGLPPGTQRTMIEMLPYGQRVRRDGRLVRAEPAVQTRTIDFGRGPVTAMRLSWGDIFMAHRSTGIPNIEDYAVLPRSMQRRMPVLDALRPLFRIPFVREFLKRSVKPGSTPEQRLATTTHVWGEVEDATGRKAAARLHGPEAGVVWTARTALAAIRRVLAGDVHPGFQTPGLAYGPDLVLEAGGATREDLLRP